MNRIDFKFQDLKEKGEKALITFITAGDPSLSVTQELVLAMENTGADIVELGIPYSDPIADGPVIQESSQRALNSGARIKNIMETVKTIRLKSEVPLVYLVYYNSIFRYGMERFIQEASLVGVDGLIIPDLPLEERGEILEITDKHNVHLIPLVAPTSGERIKKITESAKGFVYCVSRPGVTGVGNEEVGTDTKRYMNSIAKCTSIPRAIGFGVSGPAMAKKLKEYSEGIIIGSAIVDIISQAQDNKEAVQNVSRLVEEVKAVL